MAVKPIPDGYHNVTPCLLVRGAAQLIDFMKDVFGAEEKERVPSSGRIMHAEVTIGDSVVMLSDAFGEYEPMPAVLYVYVEDVDAVYKRALEAGATPVRGPEDAFWGDRHAQVKDAFGNLWWMGTHVEDVSMEELKRRLEEMMVRQA